MTISVQVPDALAKAFHLDGPQLNRRALEALALDGYRTGELSRGQVSELLDLEVNETMGFLKEHGCAQSITIEEFEPEAKAIRELLGR
jgi:predicted HTH domain antitoxin